MRLLRLKSSLCENFLYPYTATKTFFLHFQIFYKGYNSSPLCFHLKCKKVDNQPVLVFSGDAANLHIIFERFSRSDLITRVHGVHVLYCTCIVLSFTHGARGTVSLRRSLVKLVFYLILHAVPAYFYYNLQENLFQIIFVLFKIKFDF
jgi:hypothetical protein